MYNCATPRLTRIDRAAYGPVAKGNTMKERIEEFIRKEPFMPFRLIFNNGHHYDVLSPLMVAAGESELTYYFPKSDRLAHARLNQLVSIETLDAKT
jgi:hypothetical protein